MDNFSLIHPLIKTLIPFSVPSYSINDAIREALREFCAETLLLKKPITLNLVAGTADYSLTGLTTETIVRIVNITNDTQHDLVPLNKIGSHSHQGKATAYHCKNTHSIEFYPIPKENETVIVELALKPALDAVTIEAGILDTYAEIIRDGALAFLLSQKGNEWSDDQKASQYQYLFKQRPQVFVLMRLMVFPKLKQWLQVGLSFEDSYFCW